MSNLYINCSGKRFKCNKYLFLYYILIKTFKTLPLPTEVHVVFIACFSFAKNK